MSDKIPEESYKPTVYEIVRTDLLQCPVCHETCSSPVILPCLHSLCWDCVPRSQSPNESPDAASALIKMVCPVCSFEIVAQKNGKFDVRLNSFTANLLDLLTCQSEEAKPCDYCEFDHKAEVATYRCLDCQDNVCENCANAHRRTKITRGHKLAPFEQIQIGRYDEDIRNMQPLTCRTHEEQVYSEFCDDCTILLCPECKAVSHSSHRCISIEVASKKASKQINVLKASTLNKIPGLEAYNEYLTAYAQQLSDIESKMLVEIEKQAESLHKLVDEQKEIAAITVTSSVDDEKQNVEKKRAKLNEALLSMRCGRTFINKLLDYGRDDEILDVHKLIIDRLSDLVYTQLDGLTHKLGLFFKTGSATSENMAAMYGFVEQCNLPIGKQDMASLNKSQLEMTSVLPDINNKSEMVNSFSIKLKDDRKDVWPTGVAVGSEGNTAFVDRENRRVKVYTQTGELSCSFGSEGISSLGCPFDLAFLPNGNLVVSDYLHENLKIFTAKGEFVRTIDGHFKHPRGVAVNNNGDIVVIDCGYRRLTLHEAETGKLIMAIGGVSEQGKDIFTDPYYVAIGRNNSMIVTDWASPNIKVFSSKGEYVGQHGDYGIRQDELLQPYGVCTDAFGYMFVADHQNHRIHLLLPNGRFQKFLATARDGLWHPMALEINTRGQLVVAESLGTVKVFKYM